MNNQPRNLKIMHINAQSLRPKLSELSHFLATNSVDICSVNETWLSPKEKISIPNFSIVRKDRASDKHGGVCFLIQNEIPYETLQLNFPIEILGIKLKQISREQKDAVLITYYNPPDQVVDIEAIKFLLNEPNTILVGDLNCHSKLWLSHSPNRSGRLIEELLSNSSAIIINDDSPTYEPLHRPNYKAIIDLVLCSDDLADSISDYEVTDEFRSDHLSLKYML